VRIVTLNTWKNEGAETLRAAQLAAALDWAARDLAGALVLTGDLNATALSAELAPLRLQPGPSTLHGARWTARPTRASPSTTPYWCARAAGARPTRAAPSTAPTPPAGSPATTPPWCWTWSRRTDVLHQPSSMEVSWVDGWPPAQINAARCPPTQPCRVDKSQTEHGGFTEAKLA
jgi:hypothetical protein